MITFRRFHIDHFANYVDTTFSFSHSADHPLTFFRGHNGSGKTTLLRAMIWTVYGMDALPKFDHDTHALRPDFRPDDEGLTTTGVMCFAMTGRQNPNQPDSPVETFYYRLTRSLSHKFRSGRLIVTDGPSVRLERSRTPDWDDDSKWEDRSSSLDTLRRQYFTPELRDLIFLDADKVEADLMGEEGQEDRGDEIGNLNSVVKGVLGVSKVEAAHERTVTAAKEFSNALDKVQKSTDATTTLREEEAALKDEIDQTESELGTLMVRLVETNDEIDAVEAERIQYTASQDETKKLQEAKTEKEKAAAAEEERLSNELRDLADTMFTAESLAGMLVGELRDAEASLEALKERKGLPRAEVGLLQRLIRSFEEHDHTQDEAPTCICARPLTDAEVEDLRVLLKESKDRHAQETALTRTLDWLVPVVSTAQADPFGGIREAAVIVDQISQSHGELIETKHAIRELNRKVKDLSSGSAEYQRLEKRRLGLENSRGTLQEQIRERKRALGSQYVLRDGEAVRIDSIPDGSLTEAERGLEPHPPEITASSLLTRHKAKQQQRIKAEKRAGGMGVESARVEAADTVIELLDRAAKLLLSQNTPEMDKAVRETYGRIIGFNEDSDTADVGFGVNKHGDHDLWMKNPRGGIKAIGAANGASRRALVTSFVLALLDTSGTTVPFVSDSLLNAASGLMKSNLLREVTTGYGQPIMFGFRDDLANPKDRRFVADMAEYAYSISHPGQAGMELVRSPSGATESRSIICDCDPTMYCEQCEHPDDESDPEMSKNPSPTTLN